MTRSLYGQGSAKDRPFYRSRAEVQIAGLLDREGIAYRYEHPLAVVDHGRVRIWYPDFYLPQFGLILEYFGVHGDADYDRRTEHKMTVYRSTGVEGVSLDEYTLKRQGAVGITRQIEGVLQQRLKRFYDRAGHHQQEKVSVRDGTDHNHATVLSGRQRQSLEPYAK